MPRAGTTREPRPGCKGARQGTREVPYGRQRGRTVFCERPKDGLCHDCANLLKDGERMKEIGERLVEKGVAYRIPTWVDLPERGHWDHRNDLEKLYRELIAAISEAPLESVYVSNWEPSPAKISFKNHSAPNDVRMVRPSIMSVLQRLYRHLRYSFRVTWADGYRDGSDLLLRLSTGEISPEEFNDRRYRAMQIPAKARKEELLEEEATDVD